MSILFDKIAYFCANIITPFLSTVVVSAITALLVAIINNKMQFFGKLRIYPTIISRTTIPTLAINSQNIKQGSNYPKSLSEYLIKCICFNSKSIPIFLENFYVEMKEKNSKKTTKINVKEEEISYSKLNGISIGCDLALKEQIILPRTLHEFVIRLDINHEIVTYYPLKLVCYNEKHKRKEFLLSKGKSLHRMKGQEKECYKTVISDWQKKNTNDTR